MMNRQYLLSTYSASGTILSALYTFLCSYNNPMRLYCYYHYFTVEKTEAQPGEAALPWLWI